ncbi:hypothetical protein H2248_009744 [Termitomyces sp. 'cryptogamus']|nr:hypothetical protein H2248_009744 [Termitomyces sp. 'cryptogamus']
MSIFGHAAGTSLPWLNQFSSPPSWLLKVKFSLSDPSSHLLSPLSLHSSSPSSSSVSSPLTGPYAPSVVEGVMHGSPILVNTPDLWRNFTIASSPIVVPNSISSFKDIPEFLILQAFPDEVFAGLEGFATWAVYRFRRL